MNIRYMCRNIDWDTDGRGMCGLPNEVEIIFDDLWWEENVHTEDDIIAALFGELSDMSGFSVLDFTYDRL